MVVDEQERWECPSCGTPLNIAALGIYAKVACPACGHIDHVHTMLANFRIEGVLGLGGMSVVLRARDLVLDRPLAIKLLNEFYRDHPERIARFEQECELMAKVRHDNVVSVYSAGRVKGQFFIAMELLHGQNLEELVREQGAMEPQEALDILHQVVLGLDAACKAGLLHRDMKPANIIICEDGVVKVLDFGLSHGKRDAHTEEIIWATPYYVPPETLMREPEGTYTDIYALGMTLRHLLTGQENFAPAPEGIEEMLECKRRLEPMAEVMPELPEAYCDLIDHMTAYEPSARPESYASLLLEIAEVRASLSAEEKGMPLSARLGRAWPMLAGAAATLALGAAAAALTAQLATPAPERLSVTPPATLAWQERDALAAAMERLQAGNAEEAATYFQQLAHSSGEPTACAWACLHALMLAELAGEGEDDGVLALYDCLERHLAGTPASAGTALHGQMASLSKPDASPQEPFLRAFVSLKLAENAAASCQEQAVKKLMQATQSALREAGPAYAPMAEQCGQYEAGLHASLPERARRCYRNALASLNVQEAARAHALMFSAAEDEASRSRLAVQREALALLSDAVEMMRRHSLLPAAGEAVSPESLAEMLEELKDPQLVDELPVLLLMARGEFAQAAHSNPYSQSPGSREPFAIIMRDWLRRVK